MNRTLLIALLLTTHSSAWLAPARAAEDYPRGPIRMVVPFAPGGSTDTLARSIGQKMTETWGKQVVVDNRSGGSGMIGMEITRAATPDGHTLVLGYIANLGTAPALHAKLPYDPVRDFTPICHVATAPSIAVVPPSVPAKSLPELLALARAKPGSVNFGSAAIGSMGHLAGEMLNRLANVKMQHIAYKGGGQATIDVLAGQIQLAIIGMSAVTPHIRGGRLRAIAVTGLKRSPAFPEVGTIAEQGFPGFSAEAWYGVLGPAAMARPIVGALNAEIRRILALPDVQARLANVGFEIVGSSPEDFAKLIRDEIPKWIKVVKEAGIRAE
ncbi:MAG: tripartite tricarboxylate transporter substrate binding protein [Burkholderiales bacterium]|nr:tripartite tricarboxylate transporter substrate binding protein [Burkholderiales bacterium]